MLTASHCCCQVLLALNFLMIRDKKYDPTPLCIIALLFLPLAHQNKARVPFGPGVNGVYAEFA